ncbi:hypothetical protein [Paraferrimonas sedimenticola]|uniref:Uncharacterized protein n=1 Tax=Paraferrimonas sedimenticola TaxID=375674 RepID=A0AA37VZ02_9GAMM|nr:hypothetical protein [Paraferrimonas sedimenticola]GLP95665.1 hypothetical protein GCM10007895_09710 [Paraferrimonas sedimenticola]
MTAIIKRELSKGIWSIVAEHCQVSEFEIRKQLHKEGFNILSTTFDENNNLIIVANTVTHPEGTFSKIELGNGNIAVLLDLEQALEIDARTMLEEEGLKVLSATLDNDNQTMIMIARPRNQQPISLGLTPDITRIASQMN